MLRSLTILTSSSKAKGHALEKLVAKRVIEAFNLTTDDVRISVGAETGADVKLSNKAKSICGLSIECKRRAKFDTIYKFYTQATKHYPELIPLVVIKADYKEPLAIINLDHLLTILSKTKDNQ